MTLQQALRQYEDFAVDLRRSTASVMRSQLRTFRVLTGVRDVRKIQPRTFQQFRHAALQKGLSPSTANSVCRVVMTILRHLGPPSQCGHGIGYLKSVPYPGRRLKERPAPKWTPTLDQLSRVVDASRYATWPRLGMPPSRFWRVVFCAFYNTGLRRSDVLFRLSWECIDLEDGTITLTAEKTGKQHRIPVNETLRKHLELLPNRVGVLFPVPRSAKRFNIELGRLARFAAVPKITPQCLRRMAGTAAETISPGAGALLLGHSLSSKVTYQSYVQQATVLRPVLDSFPQPDALLRETTETQLLLF